MTKPKLSFWQIWNLSFGFLGVQIGYSLQNSNTSSIFESLGADVSHLSYFWLAAPLAGMIVQPIVGLFSDGTWTRWGRRIPYILGGSLISALALVLMPNCPKLLAFAPLAMGFHPAVHGFVVQRHDAALPGAGGRHARRFAEDTGLRGTNLPDKPRCGRRRYPAARHDMARRVGRGRSGACFAAHRLLLLCRGRDPALLTVLVTSFKTREYPPGEFARYNNLSEEDAKPVSFVGLMRNVPGVMVRLGVTQFFSWAALFLMWTYLKPAITGVVTDHATGEVLSAGATQTWVGVLNGTYPIPACIAALFLGRVAARYGNKPVYAACLLAGALGLAGLCLLHDQYALMLPMVGIGIAWAGILAMPYAILSRAVEPRRMGVYMGIFNFTITVPQIVIGLTGGAIVKYCFASDAADMLALAGVFMLLAAVSVFLVKEHKAQ